MKVFLSIVCPVFNEAECLEVFYSTVKDCLDRSKYVGQYEFVFTDNCSSDSTFDILRRLSEKDSTIRGFRFARNIGYQSSILFGYQNCSGDYAVQLDCDLQDPPELIDKMLETMFQTNVEMVYGIRLSRQENVVLSLGRSWFYRIVRRFSRTSVPVDAGDFRIVSRNILDVLKQVQFDRPYLRGLLDELGFPCQGIEYHRAKRIAGKSKFRFSSLVGLSVDALVNNSDVPLRLATWCGGAIFLLSVLMSSYYAGLYFFAGDLPPGFATAIILELASLGIQALLIGVLGEYIGRIYREIKKLPGPIIVARISSSDG